MSSSIRLAVDEVRTLGFAAIGAAYAGVGTRFEHPARIVFVQNLTDTLLMFSLDGTTDHFPLAPNGYLLLDITTNKTQDSGLYIAEGSRLYVREIVSPTLGSVYLSLFYGES